MTLTFQKESFIKLMPELPDLFHAHWKEIALDQDVIKLEPDWARYSALDIQGLLHIVTVRDEGILVGYYIAVTMPNLHYKSSKTAWSDIFYLLPDYRNSGFGLLGTGYKLFREMEKELKKIGVQKSYVVTKVHIPINILIKQLGYRFIERVYTKLL